MLGVGEEKARDTEKEANIFRTHSWPSDKPLFVCL